MHVEDVFDAINGFCCSMLIINGLDKSIRKEFIAGTNKNPIAIVK